MSMFRRRGSHRQQQEQEHHELHPESKVNELKAALGPLSGRSQLYCSDACLKRYLEARNWSVEKAKKMLEETLAWRSTLFSFFFKGLLKSFSIFTRGKLSLKALKNRTDVDRNLQRTLIQIEDEKITLRRMKERRQPCWVGFVEMRVESYV